MTKKMGLQLSPKTLLLLLSLSSAWDTLITEAAKMHLHEFPRPASWGKNWKCIRKNQLVFFSSLMASNSQEYTWLSLVGLQLGCSLPSAHLIAREYWSERDEQLRRPALTNPLRGMAKSCNSSSVMEEMSLVWKEIEAKAWRMTITRHLERKQEAGKGSREAGAVSRK